MKKRLTVIRKWRIKRLELVENFKYLGVLLDQTLSWKDHIDYITGSKISSRFGVLRRARKVLPKATCLLLYNKRQVALGRTLRARRRTPNLDDILLPVM